MSGNYVVLSEKNLDIHITSHVDESELPITDKLGYTCTQNIGTVRPNCILAVLLVVTANYGQINDDDDDIRAAI